MQRHDERGMPGSRYRRARRMMLLAGVFRPAQTRLAVRHSFFCRAVRFSFDRYKNSIATQVRSGSTILAYLVRAASWPISKPRRNEHLSVSGPSPLPSLPPPPSPHFALLPFGPFCSRARNPRGEVRHRGCNRAIFAACLRIDVSVAYL